jgi:F0F1-type ATP synthase assembly protein I
MIANFDLSTVTSQPAVNKKDRKDRFKKSIKKTQPNKRPAPEKIEQLIEATKVTSEFVDE